MIFLLSLVDAAPNPVGVFSWGALVLLLAIIFILAVGLMAGLVFLLIRLKRRELKQAETEGNLPG